jgi:hypothetical protein
VRPQRGIDGGFKRELMQFGAQAVVIIAGQVGALVDRMKWVSFDLFFSTVGR